MKLKIEIPIQPLSDNKLKMPIKVGRSARLASTPSYRRYKREITDCLSEYTNAINLFKNAWTEQFCIIANYTFYIPEKTYFTKQGLISILGGDVTNYIKGTQDILMESLDIDDKHIVTCSAHKVPSSYWAIGVELEIKTKDYISYIAAANGVELLQ